MDEPARRFLERQRVAHLATANGRGEPQVVPICFALVDEIVYLAIDQKPKQSGDPYRLRRVRNLAQNPRVSIVADVYDDHDWSQLGFVLVHGAARILTAGDEHGSALDALRAKYSQYRSMSLEQRPIVAVDVERVTTWGVLEHAPSVD